MHAAPRAALIACGQLCTDRCGSLTSSRLRHFPFALMGGRGSTKAFFLAPSLHRRRAGASAARPFCNKDAKTSLDLHALGALLRSMRARRRPQPRYQCTASAATGKARFLQIHCKKIPRSTYMMAKSWQLKALNLDQCEPLRECVLPAWSAEDTGKCSKSGEGFQI